MTTDQKITIKLKKGWRLALFAMLIYRIFLDLAYYFSIARLWAFEGFILNPDPIRIAESYLLFFVIFLLMPKGTQKLSEVVIWLSVLFSYVPLLYFVCTGRRTEIVDLRCYHFLDTGFCIIIGNTDFKSHISQKKAGNWIARLFFRDSHRGNCIFDI